MNKKVVSKQKICKRCGGAFCGKLCSSCGLVDTSDSLFASQLVETGELKLRKEDEKLFKRSHVLE